MIGIQFYHETIRTAVAVFGSLFNNLVIKRRDGKVVPVPIAYGPRVKWLDAQGQLNQSVESFENLLPRMSYELTGMAYDTNRKLNNKQTVVGISPLLGGRSPRVNAPVPYNLNFSLYLQTKNLNDGWQIVEQILPFFQPAYTVRVRNFPDPDQFGGDMAAGGFMQPLNEFDMPVTLSDVSWDDNYQGEIQERRDVQWELKFETKVNLWGPIVPTTIIYDARATLNIPSGTDIQSAPQLANIRAVGYYNQDPKRTLTINDSDSDSRIAAWAWSGGTYTSGYAQAVIRLFDSAGAPYYYIENYHIPDPTQPTLSYLRYKEINTPQSPELISRQQFVEITFADSEGTGYNRPIIKFFNFDPSVNTPTSPFATITDITQDSDGAVTRIAFPLIL